MEDVENDRQRAEVFDALAHPARITILKALSEGALGFADLKKRIGIESSGHLQHHLSKLNGLIKTDEHGKYCLSDQGKDALFSVQTVEKVVGLKVKEAGRVIHAYAFKTKTILTTVTILLVIASLLCGFYISNIGLIQSQYFYDAVNGSPLKEGAPIKSIPSLEIQPKHSFNYTAAIFLNNTNHPYVANKNYTTFDASYPINNSTFYRQSCVGFQVDLRTADTKTSTIDAFFNPVEGPNGTMTEEITNPYDFPPYETKPSTSGSVTITGSGTEVGYTFIVPINAKGNYSFSMTNENENYTINGQITVWVSTVTMETKPLKGGENFQPVETISSERVARISWRPSSLYLIEAGIAIVSPLFISALCIYLVNRKS
jgi:DNA-binding transcriptional ArsR family regulator